MITAAELDSVLVDALPELASDRAVCEERRRTDTEFLQSFFGYSFIPTLQVALDRQMNDFCRRAFALIERLVHEGDADVQRILQDEFFAYGPACEEWMKKAQSWMGPDTKGSIAASVIGPPRTTR
jgi:hypothetical protein